MEIDKTTYTPHAKKFSKFIEIIDSFFKNKEYNNTKYLNKLNIKILKETNLNLDDKRLGNLLLAYHKYKHYITKVDDLKNNFDKELCTNCNQKGGFFYNQYDNKFRVSTTPGIPVQFYDNVPNARISGFENKSSVFFLRKKVSLEFGISRYFISEKSAFPFKSDFKRTMNLTVDHAGFSFQVHWFKEGEQVGWFRQQDGYFAEISLPEYSNIDLHLSKTFHIGKLKLFANASGRNLLDDGEMLLMGLMIRDRRFYVTLGAQY